MAPPWKLRFDNKGLDLQLKKHVIHKHMVMGLIARTSCTGNGSLCR